MDKTRKYTIIFIVICFLCIGIIGALKNNEQAIDKIEDNKIQEEVSSSQNLKTTISIHGLDGIMAQGSVEIEEGKSVYDVLEKLCQKNELSIKTSGFGKIIYVKGINGLNEFDHGPQSGWMYQVNGVEPSIGAGSYNVKDGDVIEWIYKTVK